MMDMMELVPSGGVPAGGVPSGPSRRRKVNFSKREVRVLLQEVERLRGPLLGIGLDSHCRRGQQSIEQAWGHVAERVSAVAPVRRMHRDVRKKWADLKWAALRTGDGAAADAVSRSILRIIRGEDSGLLGPALGPAAIAPHHGLLQRGESERTKCIIPGGGPTHHHPPRLYLCEKCSEQVRGA